MRTIGPSRWCRAVVKYFRVSTALTQMSRMNTDDTDERRNSNCERGDGVTGRTFWISLFSGMLRSEGHSARHGDTETPRTGESVSK